MADTTNDPAPTAAPLLRLLLAAVLCGLIPALMPAAAAATDGGKILYWTYPDQFGTPNPAPNSDECDGIVILRVFDDSQEPVADGYHVLPLYADHTAECEQMLNENSGNNSPRGAGSSRDIATTNPTSCIKPLNCGKHDGQVDCARLDSGSELRLNLERDAKTKLKLNLYDEFNERRRLSAADGRWIDIRRLVQELLDNQAVSYTERRDRMALVQSFLTGNPVGEVTDTSLQAAQTAMHAMITDSLQVAPRCSGKASEAGQDVAAQLRKLREKSLDPVFELGWVTAAVSRQVGLADVSGTVQRGTSRGLRSYYRLHIKESNEKWAGPFTALATEPECLNDLPQIAQIASPNQASEARDCLKELADLFYKEDPSQTITDRLRALADRIDHWRMPGEKPTSEGYLGKLLAPSCLDRAAAFARDERDSCKSWGWLDPEQPPDDNKQTWPSQMVSDQKHLDYQLFKIWFKLHDDRSSALSQAAWWRGFRDELDRKKRPDERFRPDEWSCYHHVPDANVCVSPGYYLNLVFALLILYFLYRWRCRGV